MPYLVTKQSPIYHQISLEDFIANTVCVAKYYNENSTATRTRWFENIPMNYNGFKVNEVINVLEIFVNSKDELYQKDRFELYNTFYIPKKSGGIRRIDAPKPALKYGLYELKNIIESKIFNSYHTTAFAYIKGRSTQDALQKHQNNNSKWFLKIDFKDFFGKTTLDFLLHMFSLIHPFSAIMSDVRGKNYLIKALELCFLNDGLPQGTPISPFLTNVMMIAIDHKLSNTLRNYNDRRFVYTRYADDIIISCVIHFDKNIIIDFVNRTLNNFKTPFKINMDKVRFGSSSGKNWNLGLMLNREGNITIGHQKKKLFKAMIYNYGCDKINKVLWDFSSLQTLQGLISYYKSVEPKYISYILSKYNLKLGIDINLSLKEDLSY